MTAAAARVVDLAGADAPMVADGGGGGGGRDALIASMIDLVVKLARGRRASHIAAREKVDLLDKTAKVVRAAGAAKSKAEQRRALAEIAAILDEEVTDWCEVERAFVQWSTDLRDFARRIENFPADLLADEEAPR